MGSLRCLVLAAVQVVQGSWIVIGPPERYDN